MTTTQGYEQHEHSYVSGPESKRPRKPGVPHIVHAHAGGEGGHLHPDTGPARYDRAQHKKLTKKPRGPQLPFVERPPEESTFRVIFVDAYTTAHGQAGISPERYAQERADFLATMRGEMVGMTPDRLSQRFDLTPIYELHTPDQDGAA